MDGLPTINNRNCSYIIFRQVFTVYIKRDADVICGVEFPHHFTVIVDTWSTVGDSSVRRAKACNEAE